MKHNRALLISVLAIGTFFASGKAAAYVFDRTPTDVIKRWFLSSPINSTAVDGTTGEVIWFLNENGSDDVQIADLESAIASAFASWQNVSNSAIKFRTGGTTNLGFDQDDDHNVIVWIEDPLVMTFDAVAVTQGAFIEPTGELVERDIAVNGISLRWAVDLVGNVTGRDGPFDVQAELNHEIGHFTGLEHVFRPDRTVLFPTSPAGTIDSRTLGSDDEAGVQVLYPDGIPPNTGSISGTVSRDGGPLLGVLVEVFSGDTYLTSATTDSQGNYSIERIPSGSYKVRGRPVDPDALTEYYRTNADTNFQSVFHRGGFSSGTADEGLATLVPTGSTGIDFDLPPNGDSSDPWEEDDSALQANPIGTDGTIQLHHIDAVNGGIVDEDWVSFTALTGQFYVIETLNSGFVLRNVMGQRLVRFDPKLILLRGPASSPVEIASNDDISRTRVLPEARVIYKATANETLFIKLESAIPERVGSGAFTDVRVRTFASFAAPTITSLTPSNGPEEGLIEIRIEGTNFAAGATVTVGGVAVVEDYVISDTTMFAVIPAHSPGTVSVVVRNPDGQISNSTLFTYFDTQRADVFDATIFAFPDPLDPFHQFALSACWGDFDNDGYDDLFIGSVDGFYYLWRNQGNATFDDAKNLLPPITAQNTVGCTWVDFDNDGSEDLHLVGWSSIQDRLFRNLGSLIAGKHFEDVTLTAGVAGDTGFDRRQAAWADFDLDGDMDFYLAYFSSNSERQSQLFRNNGDGTFTDVAGAAGVAFPGPGRAGLASSTPRVRWGDCNGDNFPDLLLINHQESPDRDVLYRNLGNGTFTDISQVSGILPSDPQVDDPTMTAVWFDMDNDGDLDLFTGGEAGQNSLFQNQGNCSFTDVTAGSGVSSSGEILDVTAGDFNNDGWMDLFAVRRETAFFVHTQDLLFLNDGDADLNGIWDGSFTEAGSLHGLNAWPTDARAVGWSDYDLDGDLDLHVASFGPDDVFPDEPSSVHWDNLTLSGNWLEISLEGVQTNADGAGVIVTVLTEHSEQTGFFSQAQQKLLRPTSQDSGVLHFGLDTDVPIFSLVPRVEIFWPKSGLRQFFCIGGDCPDVLPGGGITFDRLGLNQVHIIREGVSAGRLLLSKLAPNRGPTVGGTAVTLTGFDLPLPSNSQVLFGGVPATSVSGTGGTQLTATTPPHALGLVDVVVNEIAGGMRTSTFVGAFCYTDTDDGVFVTAIQQGDDVVLQWTDACAQGPYLVQRRNGPNPVEDPIVQENQTPQVTFTDVGAITRPGTDFYLIEGSK